MLLCFQVLATYHTMNKFKNDVSGSALVAEGWAPVEKLNELHAALNRASQRSGGGVPAIVKRMPTRKIPPTYNLTNKVLPPPFAAPPFWFACTVYVSFLHCKTRVGFLSPRTLTLSPAPPHPRT